MNNFIKSYNEEEVSETLPVSIKQKKDSKTSPIKEVEQKEEIIDLDKYPTMEMKAKTTSYKITSD